MTHLGLPLERYHMATPENPIDLICDVCGCYRVVVSPVLKPRPHTAGINRMGDETNCGGTFVPVALQQAGHVVAWCREQRRLRKETR